MDAFGRHLAALDAGQEQEIAAAHALAEFARYAETQLDRALAVGQQWPWLGGAFCEAF